MTEQATQQLIGGKTIEEWEEFWVRLPGDFRVPHPEYRHAVGLYRASLNGVVVGLGEATQVPGGIEKRLSDFRRRSGHNRDHDLGRQIHMHAGVAVLEVLVTGDNLAAGWLAKELRTAMIDYHKPRWNVGPRRKRSVIREQLLRRRISAVGLVVPKRKVPVEMIQPMATIN